MVASVSWGPRLCGARTGETVARAIGTELGTEFTRTIVSGGGSNSDLMMQIVADVFGVAAVRTTVNNAAGLGSAICVAVGRGVYGSFDEAMDQMVSTGTTFEPDPRNHALYREMGAVYREIQRHTDGVYRKSHEIFG